YQILAVPIFAGAFRPFGFFAIPTLPDPLRVSGPCWSGVAFRSGPFGLSLPAFPTLPDSRPYHFGSDFVSSGLWIGLRLSTFPTLSEAFSSI
ncbi:hypothetical protein, partial [Streptomyces niger]|uniref:hypothetical protein n=1 Tax=Streptomyces niger TaxID=66373 RepID=UPI001F1BAAF9